MKKSEKSIFPTSRWSYVENFTFVGHLVWRLSLTGRQTDIQLDRQTDPSENWWISFWWYRWIGIVINFIKGVEHRRDWVTKIINSIGFEKNQSCWNIVKWPVLWKFWEDKTIQKNLFWKILNTLESRTIFVADNDHFHKHSNFETKYHLQQHYFDIFLKYLWNRLYLPKGFQTTGRLAKFRLLWVF